MKTNFFPSHFRIKQIFSPKILTLIAGALIVGQAVSKESATPLSQLAKTAVSQNSDKSAAAIAALRAQGLAGLQALLDTHKSILERGRSDASVRSTAEWHRLSAAIDTVGQQRDCHASGLFWFTDLDQAKAESKATGKPILSLRLLGKLNEEFSCANSRFFRTTLYANSEVSQYLRNNFVLHWKSVRPVPRITIDFGDGRKLERTITGNSIHYILDSEGQPIDALPGLYGPKAFLRGLAQAKMAVKELDTLKGDTRIARLRQYHQSRLENINRDFTADLAKVNPNARTAVPARSLEDATWTKMALLHDEDAQLDKNSTTLITAKYPTAAQAAPKAVGKGFVETPLLRAMRNLIHSIAEDTVRNEYVFHAQIHEWFINGLASAEVEKLNSKIYAELFLTP